MRDNHAMAQARTLAVQAGTQVHEAIRLVIVCGCGAALMLAGTAFPF
ncbi:MAG: hypothetical protein H6920_00775 [Sphingomonadaceae bacterium]|nr:hypothetical protein [Sphingomonadaceae bacterium]MCP5384832.1 hypothetical protein [Altererythrobacter sp.]MCP5390148.1 hypothetical protein [Sphingomonadaceae bacterium]MCP5392519.1 hypothetical protein [Sphingomonadaceae bacterium]